MPFFLRGKSSTKKTPKEKPVKSRVKKADKEPISKKRKVPVDDEVLSDDKEVFDKFKAKKAHEIEYKPIEEETAQEKKFRLASKYLEEIRKQKEEEAEDEEQIREAIGHKLKEDFLEATGHLQRNMADTLEIPDPQTIVYRKCKHHQRPLTCLVVSSDEKFIFTASKDCTIVKWNFQGERLGVIPRYRNSVEDKQVGHKSVILSLAISTDGKFLASSGMEHIIRIWDAQSLKLLQILKKHRGPVSGLAFRKGTHTLFSASYDRLVMVWDLDEMAFVENLGGHQHDITGIDALMRESCITSGGRDGMVIVYSIPEEKQLRFSSFQESIDGVKLINESIFVTFGQNGALALWTTVKKRPCSIIQEAHGKDPTNGLPLWLTAVAALSNTDVIASGSMDGFIRLWKVTFSPRALEHLFAIPITGIVNSLEFTYSGSHLIAAVGQEAKLGRWFRQGSAKNALVLIPLPKKSS